MYSFLQSAIFLRASNRLVNQRTRPYWTSLIATLTAVSSSAERTNIHLSSPFCAPSALSRGYAAIRRRRSRRKCRGCTSAEPSSRRSRASPTSRKCAPATRCKSAASFEPMLGANRREKVTVLLPSSQPGRDGRSQSITRLALGDTTSELLQMLTLPPITGVCIFKVLLWLVSIFDWLHCQVSPSLSQPMRPSRGRSESRPREVGLGLHGSVWGRLQWE
jgi:hypothetical protein